MTFWESARIVLKRWYIFLPMLLLCAGAAWWASDGVGREYTTKASFAVLAPPERNTTDGNGNPVTFPLNPYAESSLARTLGRALPETMSATDMRIRLLTEGYTDYYDIVAEDIGNIIRVAATDADAERSWNTAMRILELSSETAARLQIDAGAPEDDLLIVEVLGVSQPLVDSSRSNRALAVFGLAAMIVSFGSVFVVEGWSERRRDRRARRQLGIELDDWVNEARPVGVHDG